jgi:hypothetical protein
VHLFLLAVQGRSCESFPGSFQRRRRFIVNGECRPRERYAFADVRKIVLDAWFVRHKLLASCECASAWSQGGYLSTSATTSARNVAGGLMIVGFLSRGFITNSGEVG